MALKRRAYTLPSAACAESAVPVPVAIGGRSPPAPHEALMSRRVAAVRAEGPGVRPSGAAVGADLGGSSKYSSEALED